MPIPSTPLGQITVEDFLKNYWQKKTLVIKQGFKNFQSPIDANDLAGLSCEENVNSRIVIEKAGEHPWQAIYGPMDESIFASMPKTHWTLLVNDVEKHIPELAWIVDSFRFIPEWRVDDLMISYAPEGGSVGPHFDQYDVFILQAQGHRRWQISTREVAEDNQVADTNLRIQKDFTAEEEWLLEPGDIIYIPPGVSHYGVATDDCLSFSIGFRASTYSEMLNDFMEYITHKLPINFTYQDPELSPQQHSNEISENILQHIRQVFSEFLNPNHPEIPRWFGRFNSDTKADIPELDIEPLTNIETLKNQHSKLMRSPASRFAFYRQENSCLLFIDGEDYNVSQTFAEVLCQNRQLDLDKLLSIASDDEQSLLIQLYNHSQLIDNE